VTRTDARIRSRPRGALLQIWYDLTMTMEVEAVEFRGAGGVDVIHLGTTKIRSAGVGEVVVEIAAAGLNRADIMQRKGLYPAPAGAPASIPGLEFSGTVVTCGPGASRWTVGAHVMGICGGGAMARRIVVHERELMPVPHGVSLVDAAAIPEVFLTAWDAFTQANLLAGEVALIHAAASGVGTAALQLCRAMGVRAIATTRTADKLAALAAFGLAEADGIAVTDASFASAVQARTPQSNGVNMILDCVGAAYFEENLRALAPRGRMVMLGMMGGATGQAPLGLLLGKRATVIGTVMRARPLEEKIAIAQAGSARLVPMFERGLLHPVVDVRLPMAQCASAHQAMEANRNVGKILLTW
jgi:putative PIG3 family NAD(P)H quinone oxidoreductase